MLFVVALVAAGVLVSGDRTGSPQPVVRAGLGGPAPLATGDALVRGPDAIPRAAAVRRAWRYARRRGGQISIAVIDTRGRLRGRAAHRRYPSASVVKAMLLAAELRRLQSEGLGLDAATMGVLRPMITESDNDAADVVYTRVGDAGLMQVAKAARMPDFTVANSWGYAQVTAADLAILFARLPRLVPAKHRRTTLRLLRSLTAEHRWGLPAAARGRWKVYAKGGWRKTGGGQLVHQAALLRRGRRRLSVAILTDGQPSHEYGVETVRGIADRLLAPG